MNYRDFEIKTYNLLVKYKISILNLILKIFCKYKISPNLLSLFSLLSGLSSIFFIYFQPKLMFIGILGHIMFDTLDGALARYLKADSNTGKIIDLAVGNIVTTFFILFLGLSNFLELITAITFIVSNLTTEVISIRYHSTKKKIQSGGACHFAKVIVTAAILLSTIFELNWNLNLITNLNTIYLCLLGIFLVILQVKSKRINTVS